MLTGISGDDIIIMMFTIKKISLIQRGRGTGPMKPGNQPTGMVLIPADICLADKS